MTTTYYFIIPVALVALVAAYQTIRRRHSETITGIVQAGLSQGDRVGAKTANLDVGLAGNLVPGLYAAEVILNNETYQGLLYYGYNMLSGSTCLEVHLLQFDADIYGKKITVKTKKYLRPPKKFNTIEKLSEQIKKDLKQADY